MCVAKEEEEKGEGTEDFGSISGFFYLFPSFIHKSNSMTVESISAKSFLVFRHLSYSVEGM